MDKEKLNRRDFIEKTGKLAFCSLAFGTIAACSKDSGTDPNGDNLPEEGYLIDLTLEANAALNTVGGALKFDVFAGEKPIIVVRISETEVVAFSSACTHEGIEIGLPESGIMTCPEHKSEFNLDGDPTKGPALTQDRGPLTEYPAELDGTRIILTLTPVEQSS